MVLIAIQTSVISLLAGGRPQSSTCMQPPEESATLYVFNDSGSTLISGKEKVVDNGRTIVSLPRHTYQRLTIPPGRHELGIPNVKRPRLVLDVEAGKCYYVVVAYKPERSYAFPFAGVPTILEQITEDRARSLLETMIERQPDRPDKQVLSDRLVNREMGDLVGSDRTSSTQGFLLRGPRDSCRGRDCPRCS